MRTTGDARCPDPQQTGRQRENGKARGKEKGDGQEPGSGPMLMTLDVEIQALVLGALPHIHLFVARSVCRTWRSLVVTDPADGMLRVSGCPPAPRRIEDHRWNNLCTRFAAEGWAGCAIWAHGMGYPWATATCGAALRNGHTDAWAMLRKAGCPCGIAAASMQLRAGSVSEIVSDICSAPDRLYGMPRRLRRLADVDRDLHARIVAADEEAPVPRFSDLFATRWYADPAGRVELVSRLRDEHPDAFAAHEQNIVEVAQEKGDVALLRWLRGRKALWQGDFWWNLVGAGRMDFVREILADLVSPEPSGLAPDPVADESERGSRIATARAAFEAEKRRTDPDNRRPPYGFSAELACGIRWTLPANSSACGAAALLGDVDAIRELRSAGFPWTGDECAHAGSAGHVDVLRWLLDNGAPWTTVRKHHAAEDDDEYTSWDETTDTDDHIYGIVGTREGAWKALVSDGRFDLMRRAIADGAHLVAKDATCTYAARGGRLDVLRWARSTEATGGPPGSPWLWDERTCAAAASRGHLPVLRWLRLGTADPSAPAPVDGWTPCPWDYRTLIGAIQAGRPDIFRWAAANGCPFGKHVPLSPPWRWDGGSDAREADEGIDAIDEDDDLCGEDPEPMDGTVPGAPPPSAPMAAGADTRAPEMTTDVDSVPGVGADRGGDAGDDNDDDDRDDLAGVPFRFAAQFAQAVAEATGAEPAAIAAPSDLSPGLHSAVADGRRFDEWVSWKRSLADPAERERRRLRRERCAQYASGKKSGHRCEQSSSIVLAGPDEMLPVDAMLCAAVRLGYHDLVRYLCAEHGAAWHERTLDHACRGNDPSVVRWMPADADVRRPDAVLSAALRADSPAAVGWLRAAIASEDSVRHGDNEDDDLDDRFWRSAAEQRAVRVLAWMRDTLALPSVETQRFVLRSLASPDHRAHRAQRDILGLSAERQACEEILGLLRERGFADAHDA